MFADIGFGYQSSLPIRYDTLIVNFTTCLGRQSADRRKPVEAFTHATPTPTILWVGGSGVDIRHVRFIRALYHAGPISGCSSGWDRITALVAFN